MMVYNRYNAPVMDGLDCSGDKGRTRQEFKDECDINRIMAKYLKTGIWPEGVGIGRYGDFSQVGDYQEALGLLDTAEQQFRGLPAKVRDRFRNDPGVFLRALHDGSFTLAEAREAGLLSAEACKRMDAAAGVVPPAVVPPVVK